MSQWRTSRPYVRLGQMHRVPAAGDQRRHACGAGRASRRACAANREVIGTRPGRAAARRVCPGCVPQGLLGAGPGQAQARRQSGCTVAAPFVDWAASASRANIGPRHQRSMKPSTSPEASSAVGVASSASPAPPARLGVLDAAGRADHNDGGGAPDRSPSRRAAPPGRRASSPADRTASPRSRPVTASRTRAAVSGRSARTASDPACPGGRCRPGCGPGQPVAEGTPQAAPSA